MKYTASFVSVLIVSLVCCRVVGQDNFSPAYLGVTGGLNSNGMYGSGIANDNLEGESQIAGNVGVMLGYKPFKRLDIETGAYISSKGYTRKENLHMEGHSFVLHRKRSDSFFEFPVIAKGAFGSFEESRFYVLGGLSFSRQFDAEYDADVTYEGPYGQERENVRYEDLWNDGLAFPTDTMGGAITIPYEDLHRVNDLSFIGGLGWEYGEIGVPRAYSFIVEVKSFIGLLDHTHDSENGDRLKARAAFEFNRFLMENGITYEELGIDTDGPYIEDPVHKYLTFALNVGFRYYF